MHLFVRMAALIACVTPVVGCQTDTPQRDTAALPVDSGYVVADDGVRLFYRTIGAGATDVVIPLGLYMEDAHASLASADRRLIFYDPRARGRSDAGDRSVITLDRQVADLEALRLGLGMDSMALIGWCRTRATVLERLILVAGAMCLVVPGVVTDLIGVAGLLVVLLTQTRRRKAGAQVIPAPADD